MSFVHLHNHSHYSLLDGLATPEKMIAIAKTQKAPALAITDHGVLSGAIEFYQKAKAADIKPIIGVEAYVAPEGRFQRSPDKKYFHLILLAQNKEGYENLLALITKANTEGFYYKPRIDHDLLKEHHKGLIALSACLMGEVADSILNTKNPEQAEAVIKKYQNIFGAENFFLELQHHPGLTQQETLNTALKTFSKKYNAPLVATNDAHYTSKEEGEAHDLLLCIQTQRTVNDHVRLRYEGDFSLCDPEILKKTFADVPEAITNTMNIAERCSLELQFKKNLMPVFTTPWNKNADEYLEELCKEGLKKRYGENPGPEIQERLTYELSIIKKMGFANYFLIVQDFVMFAKNAGILVGPGRGSAAGSIIAYVLNITDVDPLRFNLLFERFLNPERVSMPDIDIDFADHRRTEVLDYVIQKYGRERVAQIITFGTMAARAAVRDCGRALGMPYSEVDVIAKLIPGRPGTKLKDAIEQEPELKKQYVNNDRTKKLLTMALQLEGCIRNASVHACAVVMAAKPLMHYTPLQLAPGDNETIITQYSMKPIEEIGLLKMDFLGLKNLTILEHAISLIKKKEEKKITLKNIPLNDEKTFTLMALGQTTGVFQFESPGMRGYLRKLKPTRLEDLTAMNALYRPGPMEWIPKYIDGKYHPETIKYQDPSFAQILEETYGVAVYQEQIMQIAQIFAGFSLGQAYLLLKGIAKKISKVVKAQRKQFIEGAIAKGHTKKKAEDVFDNTVEPFAGYGFNKSHAVCYALIAYQTAYLKANYPAEFMAALMTSDEGNTDRLAIEITECETIGITVLPPSVNESGASFTVVDDTHIRFGLAAIKGLGGGPVEEIITARKTGPFTSLEDFVERTPQKVFNKKTLEALAYSGALDCFEERKKIIINIEEITRYAKMVHTQGEPTDQTDIFGLLETKIEKPKLILQQSEPATDFEKLKWEKMTMGMYVSHHPLDGLKKYLAKKVHLVEKLKKTQKGERIKIGGIVVAVKKVFTKTNQPMLYGTIEDPTGRIEVTVFPKYYENARETFKEDHFVIIEGKLEIRRDTLQVLCDTIKVVPIENIRDSAIKNGQFDAQEKVSRNSNAKENKEEKNDTITITLPEAVTPKTLEELKAVLVEAKGGNAQVEIAIGSGPERKRIPVPFGIKMNSALHQTIEKILENCVQ